MEPPPGLPAPPSTPLDLFLALAQIASPSGAEGRVISAIEGWLSRAGVACARDGAAALTGPDTGNLIARRFASPDQPTVLFVSHVDTVELLEHPETGAPPFPPAAAASVTEAFPNCGPG